jgi:hypothetical protein
MEIYRKLVLNTHYWLLWIIAVALAISSKVKKNESAFAMMEE